MAVDVRRPGVRVKRYLQGCLLALSVGLGCTPTPHQFSPETRVSLSLNSWAIFLAAGDTASAERLIATGYQNQGRARAAFLQWGHDLVQHPRPAIDLVFSSIVVDGDVATTEYVLTASSCSDPDGNGPAPTGCTPYFRCDSTNRFACGWLRNLKLVDGTWELAGDGAAVGTDVVVRNEAGKYSLEGQVLDSAGQVRGAALGWLTGQGTPMIVSGAGYWTSGAGVPMPDTLSSARPLPWSAVLTLTDATGSHDTIVPLPSTMKDFAANLQPSGDVMQPISFSWTGAIASGGFDLEVADEAGTIVWQIGGLFALGTPYGGPSLVAGATYVVRVAARDVFGNTAVTQSLFRALSNDAATPVPVSVTPNVASAGDTITVTGSHFLSGATVLLGNSSCENVVLMDAEHLTCLVPALAAGHYNLTVVNPSGSAGLLPQALTVP
jgi:hypothetical protein